MNLFKRKAQPKRYGSKIRRESLYDYTDARSREETIRFLRDYAVRERAGVEAYWKRMRAYYDGEHDTDRRLAELLGAELDWTPAHCPDGFLHVETQIDPSVPDFEFCGRGGDDVAKAEQQLADALKRPANTTELAQLREEQLYSRRAKLRVAKKTH